jgi:hypothetical protein
VSYANRMHRGLRRAAEQRAGSAEVLRADFTGTTYQLADVDVFEADTLTVTSRVDGRTLAVFPPGTWRTGSAYGSDGYPLHSFTSHLEAERRAQASSASRATSRGASTRRWPSTSSANSQRASGRRCAWRRRAATR